MSNEINYGPLAALIGVWQGDKGMDVSPSPKGSDDTPYHETLTFSAIGDVGNAQKQTLSVLRYHQVVQRKANDEVFHDEIGYWMFDPKTEVIMHSLTIPRGVCVLAGGKSRATENGGVVLEVAASVDDKDWQIVQSPFMRDNARTTEFRHKITVENGKLSYSETMILDIYGKTFDHTDENELIIQ